MGSGGSCAVIDYATKYCLAATVTPTSRGADALTCLLRAVDEARRVLDLDDLRADRGEMDAVDAEDFVIGQVPAPVAVVTDNGPCFRGGTFAEAFTGDGPLLRHVRTRIRSPQTNGVVERFFGTVKYEHLYRAIIGDGNASLSNSACSAAPTTPCGPTRPSTTGRRGKRTSPARGPSNHRSDRPVAGIPYIDGL